MMKRQNMKIMLTSGKALFQITCQEVFMRQMMNAREDVEKTSLR